MYFETRPYLLITFGISNHNSECRPIEDIVKKVSKLAPVSLVIIRTLETRVILPSQITVTIGVILDRSEENDTSLPYALNLVLVYLAQLM